MSGAQEQDWRNANRKGGRRNDRGGGGNANRSGSNRSNDASRAFRQDVRADAQPPASDSHQSGSASQGPPTVRAILGEKISPGDHGAGGQKTNARQGSGGNYTSPPRAGRLNPAAQPFQATEKRKLLILDINGVLLRRDNFVQGKKRTYIMRPHWESFLEWCFANFACALWSCGKKETLEMEVFGKYSDRLVFVFDQDKSTSLWPRRSIVAKEKPLFLKELRKLWSEDRRWNENNTILLDNHSEKFERNPPGTCFLVPDFVSDDDNVLHPDGPLVKQLDALLKVDNLEKYARQHADLTYFAYLNEEPPIEAFDPAVVRKDMTKLFVSSKVMQNLSPERDEEFYLRRNDTFGPRAIPFRRRDMGMLVENAAGYKVCEKTDGKRVLFYIPASTSSRKVGYFVDRAWTIEPVLLEKDTALANISISGGSILDGERVELGNEYCYLVFDAVFINGEDVGAKLDLSSRLASVIRAFGDANACEARFQERRCVFVVKSMRSLNEIRSVDPHETTYPSVKGKFHCDGFVFTPSRNTSYYQTTVLKYKPSKHLTIDFMADLGSSRPLSSTEQLITLELEKFEAGAMILDAAAQAKLDEALGKQNRKSTVVIECRFDSSTGYWNLVTVRKDKKRGNSPATAWMVMESIVENLQVEELVSVLEVTNPEPKRLVSRDILNSEAAKEHYDERQRVRDEDSELDTRIAMVRRSNNFVKSALISSLGNLAIFRDIKVSNVPTVPERLAQLNRGGPQNWKGSRREAKKDKALKVLDLACGRGGDLNKWFHNFTLNTYVGADVSPVALKEAASRAQQVAAAKDTRCEFVECDARVEGWSKNILDALGDDTTKFDVISIQLAVHYFCETREKTLAFFKEVRSLCAPGARILVTMLDEPIVTVKTGAKMQWSNRICKVDMLDRSEFGAIISFTLGDAVVDLPEPLPDLEEFKAVLSESGFAVRHRANVSAFIDRICAMQDPLLEDLQSMIKKDRLNRGMTLDEWQVLELYCMVVIDVA